MKTTNAPEVKNTTAIVAAELTADILALRDRCASVASNYGAVPRLAADILKQAKNDGALCCSILLAVMPRGNDNPIKQARKDILKSVNDGADGFGIKATSTKAGLSYTPKTAQELEAEADKAEATKAVSAAKKEQAEKDKEAAIRAEYADVVKLADCKPHELLAILASVAKHCALAKIDPAQAIVTMSSEWADLAGLAAQAKPATAEELASVVTVKKTGKK